MSVTHGLEFRPSGLGDHAVDHDLTVSSLDGSAALTVPLRLSPGRSGHGPALSLRYIGSAAPSAFGNGWVLSGAGAIGVDTTRGLPTYDHSQDRYSMTGGREIVPVLDGAGQPITTPLHGHTVERWRSRIEKSYERLERWVEDATGRVHWVVRRIDGSVRVYGRRADNTSRVTDPNDPRRVFQWLLEADYSPDGNATRYVYKAEDDAEVDWSQPHELHRFGQVQPNRYLKRIAYGNTLPLGYRDDDLPGNDWLLEVVLDYGEHADVGGRPSAAESQAWTHRPDPTSSRRAGFEVRTRRLCHRILMFHRMPELGATPLCVLATELDHDSTPAGSPVRALTHRGYRTDLTTGSVSERALPALSMTYSEGQLGSGFELAPPSASANTPAGLADRSVRWIDLLGEGVPGLLSMHDGAWFYSRNLGGGQFSPQVHVPELPNHIAATLGLSDFTGDGNLDMVTTRGRDAGFYERDRHKGMWLGYQAFTHIARADLSKTRPLSADLNGDGYPDLLVDQGDHFLWYPSLGRDGFEAGRRIPKPDPFSGGLPTVAADGRQFFFADMTGDGLADMVEIRNGSVTYWPHRGHGLFGNAQTMSDAPTVGGADFNPSRLRLVDLDGTGTADLLYLDHSSLRIWPNLRGDAFGPVRTLDGIPIIEDPGGVEILDFLGNGTRCLVWSSRLPGDQGRPIRYLQLDGVAPNLLLSVENGIGLRSELQWRWSAQDYLADQATGTDWATLLPRHRMVVGQQSGHDLVTGVSAYTQWAYADGHFDDEDRIFAGFGRADSWDTDRRPDDGTELWAAPSLTRVWYHLGTPDEAERLDNHSWSGDPLMPQVPIQAFDGADNWSSDAWFDGFRALRGLVVREEFHEADPDGNPVGTPLRLTQFGFRVRQLQAGSGDTQATFAAHRSEVLSLDYDGIADDPRTSHALSMDPRPLGGMGRQVNLSYPRRSIHPSVTGQDQLHTELTLSHFEDIDQDERYQTAISTGAERFILHGLPLAADAALSYDETSDLVDVALLATIDFHAPPSGATQARRVGWERLYYDDGVGNALPHTSIGSPALLHHAEQAAMPLAMAPDVYGAVLTPAVQADTGWIDSDGHHWVVSASRRYDNAAAFFRLVEQSDQGGGTLSYLRDPHNYLCLEQVDALGNRVVSTPDYQVLAASSVTDANGNRALVVYGPLGGPVARSATGTQVGRDGAVHDVGFGDLVGWVDAGLDWNAALANPAAVVQDARIASVVDLEAWSRGDGPPRLMQIHNLDFVDDGEGGINAPRIGLTIHYLDGFGRSLQTKQRVDAGPAIQRDASGQVLTDAKGDPVLADAPERWWVDSHDVVDIKGRAIRRHEPFFSPTPDHEDDTVLQQLGASEQVFYDAGNRAIEIRSPNGTTAQNVYAPWRVTNRDGGDNLAGSSFESDRTGLPTTDPEGHALAISQAYVDTPVWTDLDPIGRTLRQVAVGGALPDRVTSVTYDDHGLIETSTDERGLVALTSRRDMIGLGLEEHTIDGGTRLALFGMGGLVVHSWAPDGVHTAHHYDVAGRPTHQVVAGSVVRQWTYGDDPAAADAQDRNLRGRLVLQRDDAGEERVRGYSPEGSALHVERQFRQDIDGVVDWGAAVAMNPAVHTTQQQLGAGGEVLWSQSADGVQRRLVYSLAGQVEQVLVSTGDGVWVDKPIVTGTTYLANGQRTQLDLGNGVSQHHTFDRRTRSLTQLEVASAAKTYLDVRYTYDAVGNLAHLVDQAQEPTSGTTLLITGLAASAANQYWYDPFYQLTKATGRVHQALLPNDFTLGWSVGGAVKGSRHLTVANGAAVERYTRTYAYDLAGNITQIKHVGTTTNWTRDIWVSATSNRSRMAVDLGGNPVPNPEASFDARGQRVDLPHVNALAWDPMGRLSSATVIDRSGTGSPNDSEHYQYAADSARLRRVTQTLEAGVVVRQEVLYLPGCEIRTVTRDGVPTLARTTAHLTDGQSRVGTLHQWTRDDLALETDDIGDKKLHYVFGNHLGSATLELDEGGGLITYEEYFPFGGTSFIAADSLRDVKLKEIRYSGKIRDDATGLYYYGYRYYAVWIGNWVSPDPAGAVDGLNLYRFVHNNPLRFVDPNGLEAWGVGNIDTVAEPIRSAYRDDTPASQEVVRAWAEGLVYQDAGGTYYRVHSVVVVRTEDSKGFRWWAEAQRTRLNTDEIVDHLLNELKKRLDDFDDLLGADPVLPPQLGGDGDPGSQAGDDETSTSTAPGANNSTAPNDGTAPSNGNDGTAPGEGQDGNRDGETPGASDTPGNANTPGPGPGAGTQGPGQAAQPGAQVPGPGGRGGTGTLPRSVNNAGNRPGDGTSLSRQSGQGSQNGTGSTPGVPGGTAPDGSLDTDGQDPTGDGNGGNRPGPWVDPPDGFPTGPNGVPYDPSIHVLVPEEGDEEAPPGTEAQEGDPRGQPGSEGQSSEGQPGGPGGASQSGQGQGAGQDGNRTSGDPGQGPASGTGGSGLRGGRGEHELPSWLGWVDTALDGLQLVLDVVGLIPGLGEIADGINGLISLARGDYVGAALSFAAMIPFAGWGATAAKFGRNGVRAVGALSAAGTAAARHGDEVAQGVGAVSRHADEVASTANAATPPRVARPRAQVVGNQIDNVAHGYPARTQAATARTLGLGKGLGANRQVDRIAHEIAASVDRAHRVLDAGSTGGTAWGRVYQRWAADPTKSSGMLRMARGNALQQIADESLKRNRYLTDAGVRFNTGSRVGTTTRRGNLVRPDYQIPLGNGKWAVIDLTTLNSAPKINKYLHPNVDILINVVW